MMSTRQLRTASSESDQDLEDPPEIRKVTISMPSWMLEDLRRRARARGVTVTELMRRAVSLERMLFEDNDAEVIVRYPNTGKETVVRLL